MAISQWSTTAGSNTGSTPEFFPENQTPSSVNDCARQLQASVRTWYEDAEWANWGDTVTRTGNTTFTISGDVTSRFEQDRRIKCYDATTLYGTIASSSYSAPNTTITITADSGNLSTSLSSVALAILKPTNQSIPRVIPNLNVGGTITISGAAVIQATLSVSGGSTLSGTVVAKTSVAIDNLLLDGNSITATDTNGFINLVPNGTGGVLAKGNGSSSGVLGVSEPPSHGTAATYFTTGNLTTNRNIFLPNSDIANFLINRSMSSYPTTAFNGTTAMPQTTRPQNTDGTEFMTISYTPKSASNKLVIRVGILGALAVVDSWVAAIFQDSTANCLKAAFMTNYVAIAAGQFLCFQHEMDAGTTSATTFKVRAGSTSGNTFGFQQTPAGTVFLPNCAPSFIEVLEYSA